MRIRCPVCGREVDVMFTPRGSPVGGLYEVVVMHRGHCFKVFIDTQRYVRRMSEVECIHADELVVYIDGDVATVHTPTDAVEIPSEYLKTAVETELRVRKWSTRQ
jgi:hypothetical protein